jgi:hypothetical protein
MAVSRRNSALQYYVNGRRAKDLHGLTDLAGNILSSYDDAVTKAVSGLKRRALPAASRAVRSNYGIKARELSGKFRVETGIKGGRGDRSDYLSIWASTRRIPLLAFAGRWGGRRSKGAMASIMKSDRKVYDSSFIATIRGRTAIRVRSFNGGTGKRYGRGPVRMLYGPSAFEMLSGLDHAPSLASQKAVLEELTGFYSAELRRQFSLQKGRNG